MKKILIIEDFPILRQALKAFFELEGYWCAEATNGAEALALLDGGQMVDVIITDNHMPVMNGLEFLAELKRRFNFCAVPTIIYSGGTTTEEREQSLKMGVVAVLDKPVGFPELSSVVAQALGLRTSEAQIECAI